MIRSSSVFLVSSALILAVAGCGTEDNATKVDGITFDPCQPLVVVIQGTPTDAQRQGVADGLALWNALIGARLSVADGSDPGAAPTLPLLFQDAAPPFHGLYDPKVAQVYINTDLSGEPERVAVAHEVGHAFGLVHVTGRQSVMNSGNLTVEPNAGDAATLAGMWGACNTPSAP